VIHTIPVGLSPQFTAYDPLNNRAYVANDVGSSVSVIASIPESSSLVLLGFGTFSVVGFTYLRRRMGGPGRATNERRRPGNWAPERRILLRC
jgi:hypothetical protein